MMADGSLSGAADGAIRAVAEGRPEDILSDTFNGLIGGAIASPIIGGGMRAATKLGSTTKNYANDLIDGFNFAEKAYNNPNIKKISKNFVEFSPELEPVISFLVTDEQFNKYISKKGIKEELQNLIYMLRSTNSDSFTNFKSNLKANITQSDISETVASDSTDMMERIIINLKDITSGNYAPSGEVLAGNSTDDIANGLYLKFRAETQGEIQGLYKSIAEKTSDLVMDSSTMPNNSSYFNKEITEDDIIKQYQKIIELFGVGPTKMAQNLSGDDTKMADFFINLIQKIDDSSFDLSDFDLDKQMSYMQQAMKNTKSGCSFTRTEEEALREFSSLFPEKGIKSVKKMSAASIGETFLVNCDDGTEEGVNIIIKAIKNGVSRDSLEEENNLIAHVINSIANDEQQQQANELVKMLNSLYGDFSEELDFGNEAHANSLLKKTLKRSKVAEVLEVSSDGRALTMELAQGIQANKLMTILKTYKNDLEYREAIDDMISEYKLDPDNFQLEKYLNEDVYEKRIGTYAKILKDNPAMSEPIEIMRKLSNAEISSFCEQMIFVKKIDGSTGTIMHGDPHSGNFFINFDENNNKIVQKILISGDSLNTEALIANKDNSNATLLFYHDKILCGKSSISSPFNFEDLQLLNSNAIHKITLINEQGQESSMSKDFNFKKINSEDLKDIYNSLFNKLFHSLPEEIKKDFKNKKINKTKAEKLILIIKLHQDTKAGMQTINQFWADNASKYGLIYKSNMIFNEK